MKFYRSQQLTRPDLQAHIYSHNLLANVSALRSLCNPQTKFCAVVKSNAYGHGLAETANILKKANVDFFAVAVFPEAINLASLAVKQPILIFEPLNKSTPPDLIHTCAKENFHCTIASLETMEYLQQILTGPNNVLNLHVNVESGMERCGIESTKANQLIRLIDNFQNTKLAGVYTHFASADEEDLTYSRQQLAIFNEFLKQNKLLDRKDVIIHAANSAATLRIPEAHFDMVRCGISLYGYYPLRTPNPPVTLSPAVKLQAPIIHLKEIPTGNAVSYGGTFRTQRDTIAAVLSIGYADGYSRCFSNKAKMKITDRIVNIIGRVCMGQLIIDVTDVPDVTVGQMVTVIDNIHDSPCGAYALAEIEGSICYEILASIPPYASRIVH